MAAGPAGPPQAGQPRDDVLLGLLTCPDAGRLVRAAAAAAATPDAARVAVLYRLDGYTLRLAASVGLPERDVERYAALPLDVDLPVAQAARERRAVYATAGDFPRIPGPQGGCVWRATEEFACLPLTVDGELLGVLALLQPGDASLSAGRPRQLHLLATACALRWARLLELGDRAPLGPESVRGEGPEEPGATEAPGEGGGAEEAAPPRPLATGRGRAAMLELAMSNAHIGSFDWDFATGRLVWDERLCELFGITPDAFDGRVETFYQAVHPEDRALVDAAVQESLHTGRYHVVYRVVRPDGAVRWIDAESRVVYADDGTPQGMIGVAQDRTEGLERETAREARRRFVLDLTHALTAALTPDDVVRAVIDTAMPALDAAAAAVYLREEGGGAQLLAAHGFDAEGLRRLRLTAAAIDGTPLLHRLHAGHPLFFESPEEYIAAMPAGAPPPAPYEQACCLLPLTSTDGFVGTCVLIHTRPHVFAPEDRTILTAAGGILGQSLARARLYDTRRSHLTDLQRLMLPRRVPEVPGLEIAVRYVPGSEGLDVGGDWYDVLPRPDGRVGLVIGDVQGHSAQAAAVMGQLRTAMRTYAAEGHGPVTLMQCGNTALRDLDTDLFATCCVAEIDPSDGRARIVRAGHPYPLLLEPDGRARELEVPGGMPLGTFPEDAYPVTAVTMRPGSTLLLYTDGLVERRGTDYTAAVTELTERFAATAAAPCGLAEVAGHIAAPAASPDRHDDIALVLVRRPAAGA
ncbi:SpoIIE family protein phosphatase [Streptomyces sp. JJ36]|uniref:SpoIIE family protein phosphatase n=1 Tax=Streptomyces sp. JJ36 TaxID=2736645 RepID=UPI001EFFADE7|nr:SpoIIE family protein phosphatase [Streptomyces sp. JJ36]MCF6524994.1 SpoIIE family protein phosphatase [Streptomyces sp. JJ36]